MTFADQADKYLAALATRKKKRVKKTTLATFQFAVRAAIPVLGAYNLQDIESEQMRLLVQKLTDEKYAPKTINLVQIVAKKVIASPVDARGNPLYARRIWNGDHIDCPDPDPKNQTEAATVKQIEDAIAVAPSVVREFIIVQAATGCRKGELLGMNVEDFDASDGLLHVRRTRGEHGESSPKSKSGKRDVDLHSEIVAVLQGLLAGRSTGRLFEFQSKSEARRRNPEREPGVDHIRWAFEKLGLRSHQLRHYRFTYLQMAGVPNPIRDYWIGHGAVDMEKIYGHLPQSGLALRRELAEKIGIGFTLPAVAAPAEVVVSA